MLADTDSMVLASDANATTCLAAYLNAAMARDERARAAYAAQWGVQWTPLGNGHEINDGATASARTVR